MAPKSTLLFAIFLVSVALTNCKRRKVLPLEKHPWRQEESEYDYDYYGEDYEEVNAVRLETLRRYGNATHTSKSCLKEGCRGDWGAWQTWTGCILPIPGNTKPNCYNTLRTRRRFCAQEVICHQVTWRFCTHEESCLGQWSQWSEYDRNCTVCDETRQRNRTCMSPEGKVTAGICIGSKSSDFQKENEKCYPQHCPSHSLTMEIGLIVAAGAILLFLVIISIVFALKKFRQRKTPALAHVGSSSFLVTHWRIISQRFMRRTRSEPHTRGGQELAIGSDYSAVHVYESAEDYAQVQDGVTGNRYESLQSQTSSHGYEVPLGAVPSHDEVKGSISTEYEAIGVAAPYAAMQPAHQSSLNRAQMRRAHSLDNILALDRNIHRQRQMPGIAMKPPMHRGVSQLPLNRTGITAHASSKYRSPKGGAASRITKRKKSMRLYRQSLASSITATSSTSTHIQEDHYGYLVPNVWSTKRQNAKTFSVQPQNLCPQVIKTTSLPLEVEIDTYVTMRSDKNGSKVSP